MKKRAIDYGREIATGSLDPRELVASIFETIDASDLADDIFTVLTRERAEKEAQEARDRQKGAALKSPWTGFRFHGKTCSTQKT